MKTQKYIVTIEMPDGDMISPDWLKGLIQSNCNAEDEGRDKVSVEEVSTSEDLEEEIKRYIPRDHCPVPDFMETVARHFANWQKGQDESRMRANIQLANTDVPVDTDMEIAFNDIWQDCEVRVERDGNLDEETTEAMKALCHDFFESGKEWQKSQMPMPEDTVLFNKGVAEGRRLERQDMLKDAVDVKVVESYGCEKGEDGEWRGVVTPVISFETADFSIGEQVKIVIVPIKED